MKMVNIMNYKILLYAIFLLLSVFALSGVNFNGIMKKEKEIEAHILVIVLSIAMSYMLTNFVWDFLNF